MRNYLRAKQYVCPDPSFILPIDVWSRNSLFDSKLSETSRMKHMYLLAIIVLARLTLNAQSLNGHVIDSATHLPIEGASVYFPQLRLGATSDRSGSFSIRSLPKGVYDVEVQSMGHATVVR